MSLTTTVSSWVWSEWSSLIRFEFIWSRLFSIIIFFCFIKIMIMIKSVPLVLFVFKDTDQEQKRIQPGCNNRFYPNLFMLIRNSSIQKLIASWSYSMTHTVWVILHSQRFKWRSRSVPNRWSSSLYCPN